MDATNSSIPADEWNTWARSVPKVADHVNAPNDQRSPAAAGILRYALLEPPCGRGRVERLVRLALFGGSPNRFRTSSLDSPPSVSSRRRDRSKMAWNSGLMLSSMSSASCWSAGTIVATTRPWSVSSNGSSQPGLTCGAKADTSDISMAFIDRFSLFQSTRHYAV